MEVTGDRGLPSRERSRKGFFEPHHQVKIQNLDLGGAGGEGAVEQRNTVNKEEFVT